MSNMLTKIYQKLNSINIPVAYGHFDNSENIHIPFIIYRCNKRIVASEGDIYTFIYDFNIELYYRDLETEKEFRDVLHKIKGVVDYELSSIEDYFLLRATFSLLETKENQNGE